MARQLKYLQPDQVAQLEQVVSGQLFGVQRDIAAERLHRFIYETNPSVSEMRTFCAKNWGLSIRNSDYLIKEVRELIASDFEKRRGEKLSIAEHRLNEVYKASMEAREHLVALATMRELIKMWGLDKFEAEHGTMEEISIQIGNTLIAI